MDFDILEKKIAAYEGKKVAVVVTGGGQGIAQLTTALGASKVVHSIFVPYETEESVRLISEALSKYAGQDYQEKAVCAKSARMLCLGGLKRWPKCRVIACTAATTTNRLRQGDNQAYIAVGEFRPDEEPSMVMTEHHLKFSKLSERDYEIGGGYIGWKRRAEDREITEYILKLIFGE